MPMSSPYSHHPHHLGHAGQAPASDNPHGGAASVSLFRLYLLRALYLVIVIGLGAVVWPGVISPSRPWELMEGVVACMLAAFSVFCLLGLRYPLAMLPVLLWELLWKLIWLLDVALPAWRSGHMDDATAAVVTQCLFVVVIPLAVPWRYVVDTWVRQPGNRWR
ncbi:hypothetical protein [Ideonella sp.]|uniref:hypothetical protein n=1 Tax=Ideonella sp. TaxID=1929293 RepID=UPI0035B2A46F